MFISDVEEFSDDEDIFLISQEVIKISKINQELSSMKQEESDDKTEIKAGGMLEMFSDMKNQRFKTFAIDPNSRVSKHKIKVLDFCKSRSRLIVHFAFLDLHNSDMSIFTQEILKHDFMVLPTELDKFLKIHSFYDVAFDLQSKQFEDHHFVHFTGQIKAVREI